MHSLAPGSAGEVGVTGSRWLLEVSDLSVSYRTRRRGREVTAVDRVSLDVGENETVGLVGESGSGKTTISRAVLGLTQAGSGTVRFEGEDITRAGRSRRRELSRHLQVVFQDPYGSLSPTRTVGQTLAEPLLAHHLADAREANSQVAAMLQRVGLPADVVGRFPGEFSGGQRQRIAIARALMPSPRLVICDEPVSALDLSVQAQVLNLLRSLQREYRLSYLFIAHNLAVVRHMSHRIVVLYHGQIMEQGPAQAVYDSPGHPYTRALLEAVPEADPALQAARRAVATRPGPDGPGPDGPGPDGTGPDGPVPTEPRPAAAGQQSRAGCPFAPRCQYVIDDCRSARPPLVPAPGGTEVACIRAGQIPAHHQTGHHQTGQHQTGQHQSAQQQITQRQAASSRNEARP